MHKYRLICKIDNHYHMTIIDESFVISVINALVTDKNSIFISLSLLGDNNG